MRSVTLVWLAALLLAVPATAQTKLSAKVHCLKTAPDYSIEVGDKPGYVLMVRKQTCTEDWKIADLAVKSAQDVATGEMNATTGRDNGYHTATMENGTSTSCISAAPSRGPRTVPRRSKANGASSAGPPR